MSIQFAAIPTICSCNFELSPLLGCICRECLMQWQAYGAVRLKSSRCLHTSSQFAAMPSTCSCHLELSPLLACTWTCSFLQKQPNAAMMPGNSNTACCKAKPMQLRCTCLATDDVMHHWLMLITSLKVCLGCNCAFSCTESHTSMHTSTSWRVCFGCNFTFSCTESQTCMHKQQIWHSCKKA